MASGHPAKGRLRPSRNSTRTARRSRSTSARTTPGSKRQSCSSSHTHDAQWIVGNRQRHPRQASVVEGDEARCDRGVVEAAKRPASRSPALFCETPADVVERVEARRARTTTRIEKTLSQPRQQNVRVADTMAAGAALVAAVTTERLVIDRLADDGRGDSHGAVPTEEQGRCRRRNCRVLAKEIAML